ncbi:MAG: zinc-dependent metalloprotease [Erythrobacter sp.]|uniref:zinc-dependent metalloprotease n=1 Tax=Erythrobacter sp. TaxID=1042 RepID=UPI002B468718|nr:zinc-dependent metalloprotease [Erythrobacter sp.]WRH70188.1 MAG: zinc-dependent metalloprotease [Erythrobacter sp.]
MMMTRRLRLGAILLACTLPLAPLAAQTGPVEITAPAGETGLIPVRTEAAKGRILLTLPAPAEDGVALRVLYATAMRTGLGSAPLALDRGKIGNTQLLAFRRIAGKIAVQFENPRFRNTTGSADRQKAVASDFGISTVWLTDIAETLPDGRIVIDIAPFLAMDTLGIAASLNAELDSLGVGAATSLGGKGFRLEDKLSLADPASVKVFPDNIEVDAVQTFVSDNPGVEVENIVPDPKKVTLSVHHSFVRLPAPGFKPLPLDPRLGGFSTQVVDFGAPLGAAVVKDLANRFRLEKLDPAAPRSAVKKPITFYIDRNTPDQIRPALLEGIGWWADAFDAAGFIDAFKVELLPEGADPLDVRYNMVNWVDRATRGWAYGQQIVDPRTGEIVKGMVVLGSLRARQDIQIFMGLVGAGEVGSGGPNDPVKVALDRLAQLGAHEVGHTLGFAHNFAASTQDRASVMDYPPPRIGLVDGKPDLSDAYAKGIGSWDTATVRWLYGEAGEAEVAQSAAAYRFVQDDNARSPDSAYAWGGLWDDGADPTAELTRMMEVRAAALARFGLGTLAPGEPVANLRRRFVPLWLLHRYQLVTAAKQVGGMDFTYAINGSGREAAQPVTPAQQRAALGAILAAISPAALRVPPALLPLLSAAQNGSGDRQYDTEIFATAGGPVFDPLVAADVAAQFTVQTLVAPRRLARLVAQQQSDPSALGLGEVLDRLTGTVLGATGDDLGRRIAYRTLVTMAQVARRPDATPEVAAALDQALVDVGQRLAKERTIGAQRAWALSLSRRLIDAEQREKLAASLPRMVTVPPGDPIGEDDSMDLASLLNPSE